MLQSNPYSLSVQRIAPHHPTGLESLNECFETVLPGSRPAQDCTIEPSWDGDLRIYSWNATFYFGNVQCRIDALVLQISGEANTQADNHAHSMIPVFIHEGFSDAAHSL